MSKVLAVASLVVTVLSLVGCAAEPEVEADSSGAAQTSGDRERLDVTSSEIDEVSHARPGADAVRAELEALGVLVMDTATGARWRMRVG